MDRGRRVAAALTGAWRTSPAAWSPTRDELAEVTPLLLRSGAGALAWRRLRASDLGRTSCGLELQQAYRLHAIEARIHERRLRRAQYRLHAAGVEALLGKGWAAARHYPEPGLRPYGDLDLYVGAAQAGAARQALAGEETAADLHVGCDELGDRDWSRLLERARPVRFAGGTVRVFAPEDHLRLLALHMLRHGAWRPLWLCDLGAVLESSDDRFDWDRFLEGDPRRTDWASSALLLARDLLGADLGEAPPRLVARRLPGWLTPTVLRQWGDPDFEAQGRRRPMASYLRRPRGLLRALVSRWPNGIEATVGVRGPFNAVPRLPFQLAECVSRTARFVVTELGGAVVAPPRPPARSGGVNPPPRAARCSSSSSSAPR